MKNIEKLLEIMAALRDPQTGCPWDLEQDFSTIAPYTIEEAYEVADAIANNDMPALRGELGDLLLQVVFHARIAEEAGHFSFDEVAGGIADKMLRRHPHVFGSDEERAAGPQDGSWERIKAEERAESGSDSTDPSALAGVTRALPALKRAQKLGERAANVGFDWPDTRGVEDKIREELSELAEAVGTRSRSHIEEELGDVLYSVVNLARHLDVDPEQALTTANRKFEARFRLMENNLIEAGESLPGMELEAMDQAWRRAKKQLDET
ncbi:MAG: nucleoside triphosphate pyrophosphohydrolase [Pseudomonadota bacterium]